MSAHWNYISRKFINKTAQLFAQSRLCQAQSLMKNTWLDEKLHYFINKLSGAVISMCVLTSLFSFIDFSLSYTWDQFGFWMCTPVYFFVFSLYSKTIIHQFFLINKQTQKQHVHTAPYVMMLSLPFSSACWSSSGQLVSAALYWEQMPHQVPVPAGHTALLATAATANQKALLPGQSLMEQAWRDMLSVRLGAPGCQCNACCASPQWAEHTRSIQPPAGINNLSGGV